MLHVQSRLNISFAILVFALLGGRASVWAQTDPRPNIVFFFADDQRNDTLGCAGHPIVKTPNIDGLAKQGVLFKNCLVSHSICWVSRTTILSGLTARSFGSDSVADMAKQSAVETLYSDVLRKAGYRTGYYGKWHAKMPRGYRPNEHFDEFEKIGRNPFFKKMPDGSTRHETQVIVDRGIDFIKNRPDDKPFALNMWFNASHAEDGDKRPGIGHFPWPRAVDGMYDNIQVPPPRLNDPDVFDSQPNFLKQSINRERFFWRWDTPEKYQTNIRAYYRMISGIDHAMGRFLEVLKAEGLDKNTIIIYSADNGYYLGDRGFAGKWSHYEQSLRVPLIIYDPRQPDENRGRVVTQTALNLDFPPTFLEWAGAEVPERYQGKSLVPLVNGETNQDWRSDSFHEHLAVRTRQPAFEGIREGRYKYVRYFDETPAYEFLHDLKNDPDELVNLAGDPKYKDELIRLRTRCQQRVNELGGPVVPLEAGPGSKK
ncbi:sulfatase [bacterium]|nr:sulfatase [Mariniblastus sp.]MDA7861475.1 sulfatase [bacterium]MDA7879818.1 sulfatase [Mariniblastus sp.]MDB4399637.1 sulfatase [bacterium]